MTLESSLDSVNLSTLLEEETDHGEVQKYLSTFICEKNPDVQNFLHDHAIASEERSFSKTTIIIDNESFTSEIVGYFTLLIKSFTFTNATGATRQRLTGNKKAESFITVLIAQFGRSDQYKGIVDGEVILNLALEKSEAIKDLSALRVVCAEHDDIEFLNHFYEDNGFKKLQVNSSGKVMRFVRL